MYGTMATPMPTPMERAKIRRLRREVRSASEVTLRPDTNTLQKRNVVMPPITQSGMLEMMPDTLAKTPMSRSQIPQQTPARREAHLVSAMTPLFWLKVVLGMPVPSADRMEQMPSDSSPPWMEVLKSSVSVGSSEASYVAVRSPMVSTVVTMKAMSIGKMAGPYTPRLKVSAHKKVIAGALSMLSRTTYRLSLYSDKPATR
mmetsp:Transcript_11358/g.13432  ORF Transcript_11358/g.13432 Transcript_11358/m.13432 type:complete len:201 (+) Transcript_11358:716-1318(+)